MEEKVGTNEAAIAFTSLISAADGGVLVAGTTSDESLVLARYTSNGLILWSKNFPNVTIFGTLQLIQTPNNSIIVGAELEKLYLVIKVNDLGTVVWKKSFQMPDLSVQKIASTSENGVVLAGTCESCKNQLFLIRLSASGSITKTVRHSFQVTRIGPIRDVAETSDGGFTITGSSTDPKGNNPSVFLEKIDSNGSARFEETFRIRSRGESTFPISDGYIIFGELKIEGTDTVILRVDAGGLLAGCSFLVSAPISRITFGSFKVGQGQIVAPTDLSLGTSDFAAKSFVSHRPELNLCP